MKLKFTIAVFALTIPLLSPTVIHADDKPSIQFAEHLIAGDLVFLLSWSENFRRSGADIDLPGTNSTKI